MTCACIICVIDKREREEYERELEADIEADTSDCNPRESGDLCGGCGRCRRMQFDYRSNQCPATELP